MCGKNSLDEFQKTAQTVLNKLKGDVILSLFGAEEVSIDSIEINPKEESKIQVNEESNKKAMVVEEVKEEAKVEEVVVPNVDNKKVEASEVFSANAKEPAIMLIVCKEIAELLKKVLHSLNIEIYTGRQRSHRNGPGNRSQISRERFEYGVQLQEVGFKFDQPVEDGTNSQSRRLASGVSYLLKIKQLIFYIHYVSRISRSLFVNHISHSFCHPFSSYS